MNYIKGKSKYSKRLSKKQLRKIIDQDIDKMKYNKLVYLYNYIQKIIESWKIWEGYVIDMSEQEEIYQAIQNATGRTYTEKEMRDILSLKK